VKILENGNFSFDAFNIIIIDFLMHFDFIIISKLVDFINLFFSVSILIKLIGFKHKLVIFEFGVLVFHDLKFLFIIFFFSKFISDLAHIIGIFRLILGCFIIGLLREWYFFIIIFFIFRISKVSFFHIPLANFSII
jgi:hypothetical protein